MLFFAGGVVGLVAFGLWLFALIDVITAPADQVRYFQKVFWVLIVLLGLEPGALCWFIWGRPRAAGASPPTRVLSGSAPARGALAPDDDVDFLRSIDPHRRDEDGPAH